MQWLPLDEVETVQAQINDTLTSRKGPFRHTNKLKYNFNRYMNENEKIYRGI
jgi:hypothetical protein